VNILWQDHFAMSRLNLISSPRLDKGRKHHRRAFLASLLFHVFALSSALALAFVYQSKLLPIKSGSAPGSPSISLEKITIVSPPPQPPTPQPREPETKPVPPEQGMPVLAMQPRKPMQAIEPTKAKTRVAIHPAISHATVATTQSPSNPATAASPSSYAPGPNVLPHPPYPNEARDLRETGIVIMNVQFDVKGDVAHAEVAQSSGVPVLDSETRSFIRAHWHSSAYAGQAVSVPVQYKLENL